MIKINKKILRGIFFLIILCSSLILLNRIHENQIIYWDEAKHLSESLWWKGIRTNTIEFDATSPEFAKFETHYPSSGKTIYTLLVSGLSFFISPIERAGFFISIFFAIGTLIVLFFIIKKIENEETALIATISLALVPWFILLSRTALTESTVTFFSMLSLYFLIQYNESEKNLHLLLAGLFSGLAFASKEFGMLAFITVLIFVLWKKTFKMNKFNLKQIFPAIAGFGIIILAVWFIYLLYGLRYESVIVARMQIVGITKFIVENSFLNNIPQALVGSPYPPLQTTAKTIIYNLNMYSRIFLTFPILIFSILGIVMLKKNEINKYLPISIFLTISIAFFLYYPSFSSIEIRHSIIFLPLICGFASKGIISFKNSILKNTKYSKKFNRILSLIFIILIFLIIILSFKHIINFSTPHSLGYDKLKAKLIEENAGQTLSIESTITSFLTNSRSIYLDSTHKNSQFFECYEMSCFDNIDTNVFTHIIVWDPAYKNDQLVEKILKSCKSIYEMPMGDNYTLKVYRTKECIGN